MSEICFIEARPRIVATGAEEIVRLAGGGSDTPYHRDGQHYLAGLVDMPRFKGAFGYDDNGYTGGTVPTSGALDFLPGDSATVTALTAYYWRDAPITVDAGEERGALARRLTGIVADIANNDGTIALTLVDPSKRLDKPLLGTGFAGTGGIEGPAEVTGQPKARSWGRVFNVPGTLIDKVNNIYAFGDPACAFQAFDDVYDKGREGPLVVVVWAGSIAATFAALQAAAAPQGGAAVAPSIACVKWWTVPAGPLTADIRGETAGGYAETVVSIAARMLAAVGGPAIANQAAADALRPAPCGIHVATASDTVAQALDRLFLGSSLYWVLQPDGTIRIGQWAWGAPVASLQAIFIGRERQLPPIKSRKVGYKRNHRVHGEGEISAAVIPAGDIVYEDGTPIEAWKPAEPGAESNKPPTDKSPTPPLELPEGTLWIAPDGHQYRFGSRPWTSNGAPWTSNGDPWLGGGYSDEQDQGIALAQQVAAAVTAQVARIASDNWLTAGEKSGLVLAHKAMIENHVALNAKALALGVAATERANATAAVNALNAHLTSLSPAWSDTTIDTPAVAATITALWGAAATNVALLQAAVQGLPGAPGATGSPGIDGVGIEFVWKRSAALPATPAGNGIPAGWSDDPPAGADPLWMSKAKQELDGTLIPGEVWSTPVRQDGDDGAPGLTISASPPVFNVARTSGGSPKSGQLPTSLQVQVLDGAADVTAACTFTKGDTQCSVSNAGAGVFTLTALSDGDAEAFTEIEATYGARSIPIKISVAKPKDGSAASRATAAVTSMNATGTYMAIAQVDIVAAAGTTITGSASVNYGAAAFAGVGTRTVRQRAKVSIENFSDGGAPSDGAAVIGSAAAYVGGDGPSDTGSVSAGHSVTNSTGAPKTFRLKFLIQYYDGGTTASTVGGTYSGSIEAQVSG